MSAPRKVALALLGAALVGLPWCSPWPTADLSNAFTDHLRHAFVAVVADQRGLEIYRLPLGEAAKGVISHHPGFYWYDVPYAYPPGAVLLFLPVATFSELFIIDAQTHARLLVSFTTLLAFLAWLATLRVLFQRDTERSGEPLEPALRAVVAGFAFAQLLHAGLEGFYDPAWVGLGSLAIIRLRRNEFATALGLCVAALAIHLRAGALLPVAGAAFLGLLRARGKRAWVHPVTLAAAIVGAIDLGVFLAVEPFASVFRNQSQPLTAQPGLLAISVAISALAVAICLFRRRALAAASVVVVLLLAAGDLRGWWHASLALIPLLLLTLPSAEPAREGGFISRHQIVLAGVLMIVWAVQLQRFAWGGRAWDLPIQLVFMATKGGADAVR